MVSGSSLGKNGGDPKMESPHFTEPYYSKQDLT